MENLIQILKYHIQRDTDKIKKMNILMNNIKMVLTDTKEKLMQKIISTIEILINILTAFQIVIVFWVVVEILRR